MKTKNLLLAILLFIAMVGFSQIPTLTLLNSYTLTPNSTDTIGAFARIYYHSPRNKFYVVYAARPAGSPAPSGQLSNFAWREYNSSMVFTGIKGTLAGQTGAGDFAMVMVDSNYYHLTLASPTANYKLTKYDDDFNLLSTKTITLNACSSNIDQLLNYTNNKLIIGAMYDAGVCPPVNPPSPSLLPQSEIHQYDLSLNSVASPTIISQTKITWGSSMIFNAGNYYEVTMENFINRDLYAYKYDSNFNFINKTLLNADGQWSQGVLFSGGYYYVAFHTGDHNRGNILLGIYDTNWNSISTTTVTTFTVATTNGSTSYNCNRPFLTLVNNKLYLSYDIEKYVFPTNKKDWQAAVKVYQMNTPTEIKENLTSKLLSIFPNPTHNFFTIENFDNKITRIKITNSIGIIVSEFDIKSKHIVNTITWDKGIYFIQSENGFCTKLIVN